MIPLREDNISGMTIDEFCTQLEDIYHEYFPKSYIYTSYRIARIDGLYVYRIFAEFRLTNGESRHDAFVTSPYFTVVFATDTSDENGTVFIPDGGLRVRPSDHYNGIGLWRRSERDTIEFECVPWGWNDSQVGTPEEVFTWFKKLTRRLYKRTIRMLNNNMFDEEFAEEYKEYIV